MTLFVCLLIDIEDFHFVVRRMKKRTSCGVADFIDRKMRKFAFEMKSRCFFKCLSFSDGGKVIRLCKYPLTQSIRFVSAGEDFPFFLLHFLLGANEASF